jgi:hypothetical protein
MFFHQTKQFYTRTHHPRIRCVYTTHITEAFDQDHLHMILSHRRAVTDIMKERLCVEAAEYERQRFLHPSGHFRAVLTPSYGSKGYCVILTILSL